MFVELVDDPLRSTLVICLGNPKNPFGIYWNFSILNKKWLISVTSCSAYRGHVCLFLIFQSLFLVFIPLWSLFRYFFLSSFLCNHLPFLNAVHLCLITTPESDYLSPIYSVPVFLFVCHFVYLAVCPVLLSCLSPVFDKVSCHFIHMSASCFLNLCLILNWPPVYSTLQLKWHSLICLLCAWVAHLSPVWQVWDKVK